MISPGIVGATAFNPAKLTNLAIWLDAQDASTIALSGSAVTQWNNKGNVAGVGHATQGTAIRQPKYVASAINGKPALEGRHDGSNASQLDVSDHAGLDYTRFTVITVFQRVTDLGAAETLAGKYFTTGNQREFLQQVSSADQSNTSASADGTSTGLGSAPVSGAIATGAPVIQIGSYDGSLLRTERVGATPTTSAYAGVFNGTANYTVFAQQNFTAPFAGYIGEHLFFTRALTDSERAAVVSYLKGKWGIA